MDIWQCLRQVKWKLEKLTWSDSPQEKIFSQVVISDVPIRNLIGLIRHPFAVVHSANTNSEAENPLKQSISFDIDIFTENQNDRYGESVLVGAITDVTSGSSLGKGIAQLDRAVKSLLATLSKEDGFRYWNSIKSSRGDGMIQNDVAWATRTISFSGGIYQSESYTNPSAIALTQNGNDVNITWVDAPQRFDTFNYIIRRKSGSNPTGPSDGIAVGTTAIGVQSITDTAPGAGTWYYGIFAAYDSSLNSTPTTATNYSSGIFSSITVT